ncbi:MAG TPA: hypothetical protein ENN66_09335 [Proteobacteria bacterium]|nr:hypothetical protein [Pseudomonadota bacterium]
MTLEELIGKTPYDLTEDTEAQRARKEVGKILMRKQGFTNFVSATLSKTGKCVLFETNGRPFFDVNNVLRCYRGSSRDNNPERRGEAAAAGTRTTAASGPEHGNHRSDGRRRGP